MTHLKLRSFSSYLQCSNALVSNVETTFPATWRTDSLSPSSSRPGARLCLLMGFDFLNNDNPSNSSQKFRTFLDPKIKSTSKNGFSSIEAIFSLWIWVFKILKAASKHLMPSSQIPLS